MNGDVIQRDTIRADVLLVGAGVASLATALRLLKRCAAAGAGAPKPHVMLVEKGAYVGAHVLSGAVLDPAPFADLFSPDELKTLPVETHVAKDLFYRLSPHRALRVPWLPPAMRSKGFPIVSLSRFTAWLAKLCEKAGAEIYAEMPAAELLMENGRVAGVRLRDKGFDQAGQPRMQVQYGADLHAKVVVLGEGGCGYLTEQLVAANHLAARANPQAYALGIKELLEVPAQPDRVGQIIHTFGYPHDHRTYGGGFVYRLNATHVALGLVTGLDFRSADLDPHDLLRVYKAHPLIHREIAGGHVVGYGAKVLPEGGYFSAPELVTDGALLVGDSAGLLDSVRLKGVHLALQSGLAAGDTLFDCWRSSDWSLAALQKYAERFHRSAGWRDLRRVRNARGSFRFGALPGIIGTGLSLVTRGLLPPGRLRGEPDFAGIQPRGTGGRPPPAVPAADSDPDVQLDVLTDLFHSGTQHDEEQPCHLLIPDPAICSQKCIPAYGAPCTRFCPAQVYELAESGDRIRIQFANCLHCKTCQIKDPFENIRWVPPEAGGPRYRHM